MLKEFENKVLQESAEQDIRVNTQIQKIRQLKTLMEMYKTTSDSGCHKLMQSSKSLIAENTTLKSQLNELENKFNLQLQSNTNVSTLKEQL